MEPVDFTKLGQDKTGVSAVQDFPELTRLHRAARSLLRWSMLALAAWGGLATLLAALDRLAPSGTPVDASGGLPMDLWDPAFLGRMKVLAAMTADTLFWPLLVIGFFLLLRGVLGEFLIRRVFARKQEVQFGGAIATRPDAARFDSPGAQPSAASATAPLLDSALDRHRRVGTLGLQALRIVPIAAVAFAAIWAVMSAYAFVDGNDHWEALPWVTPPYLAEFQLRHPAMVVQRGADTSGRLTLSDVYGHSITLHGSELVDARLSLHDCPKGLGAEQLGGIPPYPGIPCTTMAQLRNAEGTRVYYLFNLAQDSDSAAVLAHFDRWRDQHSAGSGSTSSKGRHFLSATARDEAWHLEMNSSKGGATHITIRHSPR